ncbi:tyrosine-type recombinase/integrase [Chromobacterium sp. Beijing]|uniref:tyrosine-type recombinase/integrase n=1 Tax=Chromobacterium sp. Beijing TaxID=2735795 RepID=UPI001F3025FF|nr:tyrosine-type recombinase/integrase [Chromobacterium sp. Beijing]UJB31360.1 tyrosine-type recombinase/integrase [Chromobacterium sp. Beijing]
MPLLVAGSPLGLPIPLAARYAITRFRSRGLAANTICQRLMALALFYQFLAEHGIELEERASKRQFLTQEELVGLSDYCRQSHAASKQAVVTPSFALLRYTVAIDYFCWVAEPIIARIVDDARRDAAYGALQSFLKITRSIAPRRVLVQSERLGLLPEQRTLFLRVIQPGSPENPFRPELQFRNYVMLLLEFQLGPRGGEVLGLKTFDVDFSESPATLTIHRRHDDRDDPRATPAATKTYGRLLAIGDHLRDVLDVWLSKEHRGNKARYPAAAKHPYLFVNYRGEPLSIRGFRKIIETLRRRHPTLGGLCHHILRHDWNDRWVDAAEEEGWDSNISLRDQKYAMGWSDNSSMPLRYAKRAIRNSTNKKILRLHAKGASK